MVSPLEELDAAKFCGYTPRQWWELPRTERTFYVAYTRISRAIEAQVGDAHNKAMNRRHRK